MLDKSRPDRVSGEHLARDRFTRHIIPALPGDVSFFMPE
jgi:hypothetical protein